MIIIHHCTINDLGLQRILRTNFKPYSNKQIIILIFINSTNIIGVNLFFLISGYFRINFTVKKFLNIILQLFVVCDFVTLIGIYKQKIKYNVNTLLKIVNPIKDYWYISCYIGLMFFSTLLNKAIDEISFKESKNFYLQSLFFFSIYSFLFDGICIGGGYSLIWAIILYLIGGMIKKFNIKSKFGIIIYFFCTIMNVILVYSLYNGSLILFNALQIFKYNEVFIFLQSIGLFTFANYINLKIKNNHLIYFINFLASSTLMTYLLHSTCWLTYFRRMPIQYLLDASYFWMTILILPFYAFFIFIICSFISFSYKNIIKIIKNALKF
jgi:surface polysaccharide O-acyltransferase-like enzyme